MSIFLELELIPLIIDENYNLFAAQKGQNIPKLLRISGANEPDSFDEYKHYRGNWYIKRGY